MTKDNQMDENERTLEEIASNVDLYAEKLKKDYDNLINGLQTADNIGFVLATVHWARILLTQMNILPKDILSNPNPSTFSWQQYLEPIGDYMSNIKPQKGEFSQLHYIGVLVWYLTIQGISIPDYLKEPARKVWNELNQGTNGAYEIWCDKFYSTTLLNEKTKPLLDNMEEDIKKIPAALQI